MTSINKIQDIQDTVTERKRMDKVLLKTKVHGKRKWQKRQAERVFLEEQKRQGINKVFYEASSVYKLQQSLDLLHQKSLVLRNESIVGASKVIATVESVIQKSRLVNFSHEKEQREMRQGAFLLEVASTGGNQGGKQRKSKDLKSATPSLNELILKSNSINSLVINSTTSEAKLQETIAANGNEATKVEIGHLERAKTAILKNEIDGQSLKNATFSRNKTGSSKVDISISFSSAQYKGSHSIVVTESNSTSKVQVSEKVLVLNSDPEGITQSECYKFHQTRWEDAVKNSMQYNSSLSEAPLHPIPNVLENKVEKAVKTGTDKNAQSLDCLSTPIAWDGINSSVKKPKASSNLEISKRENANEIKMVKEAPKIGNQHKQESSPRDGSQSVPKPKLTTKPVVISVNRNSAKMADEDGGWKVVVKSRKCKR